MNGTNRGFSLVEVMIANVVLVIVVAGVFLMMGNISANSGVIQEIARLESENNRDMEDIAELLREARITALPFAGGNSLTYQLPVDEDGDGDCLDGNLDIVWGAIVPNQVPSGFTDLTLPQIQYVPRRVYSEGAEGFDLNRDGDRADIFLVGRLEHVLPSGASATRNVVIEPQTLALTGDYVLQEQNNAAVGDVNGDGVADPLFWIDGDTLRLNLFVSDTDEANPHFVNLSTSVLLKNPQ